MSHQKHFTSTEKQTLQHDLRCSADSDESNHSISAPIPIRGQGNNTAFTTTWSSGGGTQGGEIQCVPTFFDLLIKNSDSRQKSSPDVAVIGPSQAGEVTRVTRQLPPQSGPHTG